jgi:hypothetical protein
MDSAIRAGFLSARGSCRNVIKESGIHRVTADDG